MSLSVCLSLSLCVYGRPDETGITGSFPEEKEKAIEDCVWAYRGRDEVLLRNAKLRSLNELTYQAREEFNLMQLLRALHIHRLHKQAAHILRDAPLSTDGKQYNPQVMFAELCPQIHSIQAQGLSVRVYSGLCLGIWGSL